MLFKFFIAAFLTEKIVLMGEGAAKQAGGQKAGNGFWDKSLDNDPLATLRPPNQKLFATFQAHNRETSLLSKI